MQDPRLSEVQRHAGNINVGEIPFVMWEDFRELSQHLFDRNAADSDYPRAQQVCIFSGDASNINPRSVLHQFEWIVCFRPPNERLDVTAMIVLDHRENA